MKQKLDKKLEESFKKDESRFNLKKKSIKKHSSSCKDST